MKNFLFLLLFFVACTGNSQVDTLPPPVPPVMPTAAVEVLPPGTYTATDIEFLASVGMNNSKTIGKHANKLDSALSKKYESTYGLKFVSNRAMEAFLVSSGLYMVSLDRYLDEVPVENVREFKKNLEKVYSINPFFKGGHIISDLNGEVLGELDLERSESAEMRYYGPGLYSVKQLYLKGKKDPVKPGATIRYSVYNHPVMIIAPKEKLDMTELQVRNNIATEPSKDPAIVIRTDEGYLFLTYWD